MKPRPLEGRRILVTRRAEQAGELAARLEALGAAVLEVPLIEIAPPADPGPLDEALRHLGSFEWAAFTSANAVAAVADRLSSLGLAWGATQVASVGAATTEAVRRRLRVTVALQPEADFRAEGLLAAFGRSGCRGQRILLPISDKARDVLAVGLLEQGAEVSAVVAYRTRPASGVRETLCEALRGGVDLTTLASPSAVEALLAAAADRAPGIAVAVIGPVTEEAARRSGLDVKAVASPSTAEGLVAAIERLFESDSIDTP